MRKLSTLLAATAVSATALALGRGVSADVDPQLPAYQTVQGVSGSLKSVGSDTLNDLMTFWTEGFYALYPNVKPEIEGKGSTTAPPALISGASNLGPMSREMKAEEIAAFEKKFGYKPTGIRVALDALAVFVSKDNPIQSLTLAQVDAIFSSTRKGGAPADITTWGQVGLTGEWASLPISLYGRNSASGTYGYFKEHVLAKGDYKNTVKEQPGSAAVVQGVTGDRGGIGYSGIGYRTAGVRAVPIVGKDGQAYEAKEENVYNGKYCDLPPPVRVRQQGSWAAPAVGDQGVPDVRGLEAGPGDHGEGGIRAAAGDSRGRRAREAQLVGSCLGERGRLGPAPPLRAPAAGGAKPPSPAGSSRVTRRVRSPLRPRVNGSTMSPHATEPPTAPSSRPESRLGPPPPRTSPRTTARSVLFFDALAGGVVRVGGIMVILAVIGILVFLVATVLPLFRAAQVVERPVAGKVPVEGHLHLLAVDEYRQLACAIGESPEVVCFRPDTGEVLQRIAMPRLETARVACAHRAIRSSDTVVGTTDGRLAFLSIAFSSDFVLGKEAEELRKGMTLGQVRTVDGAVVLRKPGGNLLRVRADVAFRGDVTLPKGAGPVVRASYASPDGAGAALAVTSDGAVHLVREAEDAGEGGGVGRGYRLAPIAEAGPGIPSTVFEALVDEEARVGWLVSREGSVLRLDLLASPAIRREAKYTGEPGATRLTAAELLIGGRSLLLGDSKGGLTIWSLVPLPPEDVGGSRDPGDAKVLALLHRFDAFSSPVVTIAPSATRRSFCLGHEDGGVSLGFAPNERVLGHVAAFQGPIEAIADGSKNDGFLVVGPGGAYRAFEVDCPHPETNARALFGEIHYEGFAQAAYQYQSSAATDEAELKFCLTPLIFGTLKSTFYAMLFALPLALFGALYTSQFMHPRVRALVKPGVEVMASLPSVVLGFVAALVLAPAIEKVVPGIFAAIFGIGIVGFLAGFAWYLIPIHLRQAVSSGHRLLIALALVAGTGWLGLQMTPFLQASLFSGPKNPEGDFRTWMLCQPGTGTGLPLLRLGLFVLGVSLGVHPGSEVPLGVLRAGTGTPGGTASSAGRAVRPCDQGERDQEALTGRDGLAEGGSGSGTTRSRRSDDPDAIRGEDAGTTFSIAGASTSAATNPRTTLGRLAMTSTPGWTRARTLGHELRRVERPEEGERQREEHRVERGLDVEDQGSHKNLSSASSVAASSGTGTRPGPP